MADTSKLDSLLKEISKKYTKENVVKVADIYNVPRWKVDSPSLSYVLGGGVPKGRLIHTFGPKSSGKTLTATIVGGYIQKAGGKVAFIDAEQSFDPSFAERFGLSMDPDKFVLISPDYGEQALGITEMLIDSGEIDYIIIDSVSALVPKAEWEGEMEDQQMGLQARMMGKFLRKVTGKMKRNNVTINLINQLRMKIGVLFGSPETQSGGKAIEFFSSIELDTRKREMLGTDKESPTGLKTKIVAKKNKTGQPFRKVEIDIDFYNGIDIYMEYAIFAQTFKLVEETSKSRFVLPNGDKCHGAKKLAAYFKDNLNIFKDIKEKVDLELSDNNRKLESGTIGEISELVEEVIGTKIEDITDLPLEDTNVEKKSSTETGEVKPGKDEIKITKKRVKK